MNLYALSCPFTWPNSRIQRWTICCVLVLGWLTGGIAQVETTLEETARQFKLQKNIPKGADSLMYFLDGTPQEYYVIQLARFERMDEIPARFPKGTTLWLNPDHRHEALLLSSNFYTSFAEAQRVAFRLREEGYPKAFARPKPFMVRYR